MNDFLGRFIIQNLLSDFIHRTLQIRLPRERRNLQRIRDLLASPAEVAFK